MATIAELMGSSGRNYEVPPFPAENEFSPTAKTTMSMRTSIFSPSF